MPAPPSSRPPAPGHLLIASSLALSLGGCSIATPFTLWEVAIAGSAVAASRQSVHTAPGSASDTVTHGLPPLASVCIAYNPDTQVADILPALQTALREHRVDSRVYDSPQGQGACPVWLRYTAQLDWDIPPFGKDYQPYVSTAALTLQDASGALLSSSHYRIGAPFERSKWATTRDKLAPVVTALLDRPPVQQARNTRSTPSPRRSTP